MKGLFAYLETKRYKVHVRVFLSRYRGYLTCPECDGTRLRREARDVRVGGRTIDEVSRLTVKEAQRFFAGLALGPKDAAVADKLLAAGKATGDKLWRMPLAPEYDKLIDSPIADVKNPDVYWKNRRVEVILVT